MKPFKFPIKEFITNPHIEGSKMWVKDHYVNAGQNVGKREYLLMNCVTFMEQMYCAEYVEQCWIMSEEE